MADKSFVRGCCEKALTFALLYLAVVGSVYLSLPLLAKIMERQDLIDMLIKILSATAEIVPG